MPRGLLCVWSPAVGLPPVSTLAPPRLPGARLLSERRIGGAAAGVFAAVAHVGYGAGTGGTPQR